MLCTLIGAIILSINIQVGLIMHLYDDIGDASSTLRGSTSSFDLDNESMIKCLIKNIQVIIYDFFNNCNLLATNVANSY